MASSKSKTKTIHYYGCPDPKCKNQDFERTFRAEAKGKVYGTFTKDGEEDLENIDEGTSLEELVDPSKIIMEAGYICMQCGERFNKPKLWIEEESVSCSHCGGTGSITCTSCDGECVERV